MHMDQTNKELHSWKVWKLPHFWPRTHVLLSLHVLLLLLFIHLITVGTAWLWLATALPAWSLTPLSVSVSLKLRYNSHNTKYTLLKVHNSVTFTISTKLCSLSPLSYSRTLLSPPRKNSIPRSSPLPTPSSYSYASVIDWSVLEISHKWSHTMCSLWQLSSFTWYHVFSLHLCHSPTSITSCHCPFILLTYAISRWNFPTSDFTTAYFS